MNSGEIQLSIMTLSDLDEIAANLETDFDDFWNYNILKQEILNTTSKIFVAKSNNNIVGFAGVSFILDEAEILNIVVKKNLRNKKIGSLLFNALIQDAKINAASCVYLEVNETNTYAIKLYKNFGFFEYGKRPKYYKNSDDAVLMKLLL